jgi:ubiquinone/menaquinone biosynthesis C-methylase UbiE
MKNFHNHLAIMPRKSAHFEKREPILEKILARERWKKIAPHLPPKAKVLDLGCGFDGKFLQSIEKKISSGFGIDLSVSKSVESQKISLLEYNINQPLPFAENEFDTVVSLANLEHLENPEQCLREIYRVLKPGGKLLLTAPSKAAKPILELLSFLGLVSAQEIKDHKHYFDKKILVKMVKEAGFSQISHQYFQMGMNNFLSVIKTNEKI